MSKIRQYPQSLSDVKIGLRLKCDDTQSLLSIAHTRPVYAIVLMIFVVNGETICAMRFTDCGTGRYVTEHHFHVFAENGEIWFQQIQSLYDLLIVTKSNIFKLTSS